MPSISELRDAKNELNAALEQGLDDLRQNQTITFTRYDRRVLPLDGFVFWVNSALTSTDGKPVTATVQGYLHLTTESIQDESELYDRNSVIFTGQSKIDDFNEPDNTYLYIGEFFNGIRFAFSRRSGYSTQADLYHYSGYAVYPQMESQIVDKADMLDLTNRIVSNSLPVWLAIAQQVVPLYPAMLSEPNIVPPYGTVRCSDTQPLSGGYFLDPRDNQYQYVSEDVKITLTGLRNAQVMDFVREVTRYTMEAGAEMGVMNVPVIQDLREPQNELNVLAMRKTVTFKVNYYESTMRDIARQLILKAIPNVLPGG